MKNAYARLESPFRAWWSTQVMNGQRSFPRSLPNFSGVHSPDDRSWWRENILRYRRGDIMARKLRFGVQTAPQNTTWADLRDVWKLIDEAGYDTAWLFDHFYPILADPAGPCFEGWTALTGLAAETKNVEAGVLVTGNTYRHPAVLAKMGAALDHIIAGRLIMGIGAGWFELEHNAYGIPFYTPGERIRRLDEAVAIIKSMWTAEKTTMQGRYYQVL